MFTVKVKKIYKRTNESIKCQSVLSDRFKFASKRQFIQYWMLNRSNKVFVVSMTAAFVMILVILNDLLNEIWKTEHKRQIKPLYYSRI